MKFIIQNSKQKDNVTHMDIIFNKLGPLMEELEWFGSDMDFNYWPDERLGHETFWMNGKELKKIAETHDLQFIWGVFSGFKKGTLLSDLPLLNLKYGVPWADGNQEIWKSGYQKQIELAIIEIICFDGTETIFTTDDEILIQLIKTQFSDVVCDE